MKKKIKVKTESLNIFYINTETKQRRGFYTQEEANEFIDSVEDPSIWDVEFNKDYEKRILENLDRFKKENQLTELDKEVLKFLSFGNSEISISKYLKEDIKPSIKRLINNHLIFSKGYSEYKITDAGKITLAWSKEE